MCVCGLFKVSILVNSDPEVHEIAFQYGRNVGIAFQVMFAIMLYYFYPGLCTQ